MLALSLAILPIGMLNIATPIFLPPFFAGDRALGLAATGMAFTIVRLTSICLDPVLGSMIDRTRAAFGRYRSWMAAAAPVLMAATSMLFLASGPLGWPELVLWLLLLYVGTATITLSQSAWVASLATAYDDRSRAFGILVATSVVGAVAASLVPLTTRHADLSGTESVPTIGWMALVTIPIAIAVTCTTVSEPVGTGAPPRRLSDYLAVVRQKEVAHLMLGTFLLIMGPAWTSPLYVFYCRDALGFSASQMAIGLALFVAVGLIGSQFAIRLAVRFGKSQAILVAATVYSLALCGLFVLDRGDVAGGYLLMVVCGLASYGFFVLLNAIAGDVGDAIQARRGTDQMGLVYALKSMAEKLAHAAAISGAFLLLQWAGYTPVSGPNNTTVAIQHMRLIYVLVPIASVLAAAALFRGWRLDAKRHAEIRAEIDNRRPPTPR
jgi:Na+/melibiose symporter-like transporter